MTVEETTDEGTVINFYYPIQTIADEVFMRTSYLGRFRSREEAAHLLDLLAFSKDERDLFLSFMKSGMALVFAFIGNKTKKITGAYDLNIIAPNTTPTTTTTYDNSVHYKVLWDDSYNSNYIAPLDQHLFDAIVFYIIWRWLMLLGKEFKDDADNYYSLYSGAGSSITEDATNLVGAIVQRIPRIF